MSKVGSQDLKIKFLRPFVFLTLLFLFLFYLLLWSGAAKTPYEKSRLPNQEDFAKALYTFDIGQNDLSVGFRKLSSEQLLAALPDIANQLAKAVEVSCSQL